MDMKGILCTQLIVKVGPSGIGMQCQMDFKYEIDQASDQVAWLFKCEPGNESSCLLISIFTLNCSLFLSGNN